MAWYARAVVLLIFLMVDLSVEKNVVETNSLESIAAELKQLNQRVIDLELRDQQQIEKIAQLENKLESSTRLNSELKRLQLKQEGTINDLKDNVEELQNNMGIHGNSMDPLNDVFGEMENAVPTMGNQGKDDGRRVSLKGHGNGIRVGDPVLDAIPIRGRRQETNSQRVAFGATITPHNYGPLGAAQILKFDQVFTNDGNGYHTHSGIFTAPVGGTYVFHVTIAGWKVTTDLHYLQVMVNGAHKVWIWVSVGQQSSQMLIVKLNQMDEVYVSNERATDILLGATYSSFSGFLLYPSDEAGEVTGLIGK